MAFIEPMHRNKPNITYSSFQVFRKTYFFAIHVLITLIQSSSVWNYICPRCKGGSRPFDGRTVTEMDVDGTMIDAEATCCYLGDILCSGGGCYSANASRYCVAWEKCKDIIACPNFQTPLTQNTWQGVCGLRSLGYAPW